MSMNYMNSVNRIRFGGLASGLDTDSIVRDLMRIEQMKVDKLKQQKQTIEWRKDEYRNTTNLLRGFYDDHFDILYAKTNMTSPSAYNTLKITPSDDKYLLVTAGTGTNQVNRTISKIELAKAAYVKSPEMEGGVSATKALASDALPETLNLEGHSMTISVDGVTKIITFDKNYGGETGATLHDLVNDFQIKINEAFGENRIAINLTEDNRILLNAPTSTVTVYEHPTAEGKDSLGFALNQSNRIDLNTTLLGLQNRFATPLTFDEDGNVSFTINGERFSFSENESLRTVMNQINNSKAGVTLSYSTLTDSFELTNKNTGAAQTLSFKDGVGEDSTSNFLEALGLKTENIEKGKDAMMVLDGMTLYRSTNNFTIDGITYNLTHELKATDEPVILTMTQDVDKAFDNIKNFIEAYNKVIDSINETLSEERFKDYPPLTDEQRETLSDREVELWDKKAKSGILQRDTILQRITYDMRRALTDAVDGTSINLSSIGITTGNWTEGGKLYIDEKKLKDALRDNGDEITRLFSNRSEIGYSPDNGGAERSTRYKESGLVYRLSDILQDNIRTTRDKNGRKGTLLEKAGIVGDASEKTNMMEDQLLNMNKRIDDALARMYRAETRYWAQFTAMEKALQQMSSQSQWLAQQLGGGMY